MEYRFGVILIDYDGEVVMSLGSVGWTTFAVAGFPFEVDRIPPPKELINTTREDGHKKYQVQEETL